MKTVNRVAAQINRGYFYWFAKSACFGPKEVSLAMETDSVINAIKKKFDIKGENHNIVLTTYKPHRHHAVATFSSTSIWFHTYKVSGTHHKAVFCKDGLRKLLGGRKNNPPQKLYVQFK